MKTDKSLSVMLLVFCIVLVGFVLLNVKLSEALSSTKTQTYPPSAEQ